MKNTSKRLWIYSLILALPLMAFAQVLELPATEAITDGTMDLDWFLHADGGAGTINVLDSTGSAWGSHIAAFSDSGGLGMALVNGQVTDMTVSADIYINESYSADFANYSGLTVKASSSETELYRFIYVNSTFGGQGDLKLQGYDGSWHISKTWTSGTDFTALETGWHNFKVTVIGNDFYAYIDDVLLPGGPYHDETPFMTEGYAGIYAYDYYGKPVLFDNLVIEEAQIPTGVESNGSNLPDNFTLSQNYPNPFNPTTTINYGLPKVSDVKLVVYDISGRTINTLVNTRMGAGYHKVVWNGKTGSGKPVASGVYIYRLELAGMSVTKKLTILK